MKANIEDKCRETECALQPAPSESATWKTVALASLIIMVVMGIRQTVGLFVQPIVQHRGLRVSDVSMAFAVGQLIWGVFQPLFGAWADKRDPFSALLAGGLFLAAGQWVTIRADSTWMLILGQGILSPAGAAAGSFSLLIGVVAARISADKRSIASGIINAGSSAGQFAFALLVQYLIRVGGYFSSLGSLAGCALLTIVPSWFLCKIKAIDSPKVENFSAPPGAAQEKLGEQLRVALKTPSYILLHAGFFTCGFHAAFLTTHLPGEINLYGHSAAVSAASLSVIGLCNIVGSIAVGVAGKYFRMKRILSLMYASRALLIAAYIFAPKTETTFYAFAVATGFTWLATVPPTSGLVGKLFGTRYLSTLFGLTLLSHQVGAFLGAWLGGLALHHSGTLLDVWYADAALALFAALVSLPIKEEKLVTPRPAPYVAFRK
ncbi:MAG: MFS transporter [Synergistaceae bacterium]|jgi:predicted MFS family arabinose efflux permease|nr:MFS transporter [Synergistaceae bacterium]